MSKRGRKKKFTFEQVEAMRIEYNMNETLSIEYMAAKYDVSNGTMRLILANESKTYYDPEYIPFGYERKSKGGKKKASVYMPEHLRDNIPVPKITQHRARGQNNTLNTFK